MPDAVACPECGFVIDDQRQVIRELERELRTKRARITRLERGDEHRIESARRMPEARRVWDHWLATFKKPADRWKFGKSRKEGVLRAMEDYSVDELCEAISGARLSVWHMENGRIDIETLLSSAKTIDNHRARLHAKQSKESD